MFGLIECPIVKPSITHRMGFFIRHLCVLLNAQNIYCALAEILQKEKEDLQFASLMVNNLNMILLTSSELFELRQKLKELHNEVQEVHF